MKVWKISVIFALAMILVVSFNCEKLVEKVTETEVDLSKDIYSGSVNGEATPITIANNQQIGGGGGLSLAKTTSNNFIEVPMPITDVAYMLDILNPQNTSTGYNGETFQGTVKNNNATSAVEFGMYFSINSGILFSEIMDPTMATLIASLTLPANPLGETFDINSITPFNQDWTQVRINIFNFLFNNLEALLANPTVYIYLTAEGGDPIHVTVITMSFILPARVHVKRTLVSGDVADYSDKVKEILNSEMTGIITNNGTSEVVFTAFLSDPTEAGFSSENPPTIDIIGLVVIGYTSPNNTLNLTEAPTEFLTPNDWTNALLSIDSSLDFGDSGTKKLQDGWDHLLANSENKLEVNLFFRSLDSSPLNLQVDNLALAGRIKASL